MRPAPEFDPPDFEWKQTEALTFEVELMTRLFGGGARMKEVDEVCWLRSSAAKSAIRNWWRAANLHRFKTVVELREREGRIFGAPGTYDRDGQLRGGPGALAVLTQRIHSGDPLAYDLDASDALSAAYFAGAGIGGAPAKLLPPGARAKVQLEIHKPAESDEIRLGLRTWLLLGGAGARTRRGAGALGMKTSVAAGDLGLPATESELRLQLSELCAGQEMCPALDAVFSLRRTRRVLLGPVCQDAESAQRRLLSALREARQDRLHPASWAGPAGWGRSRWQEANALRLFENAGPYDHTPLAADADQYPRAALGLPIVFHFKTRPGGREPLNHQVTAKLDRSPDTDPIERYASPILLRPVRVWRGETPIYVPVAIFTQCLLPDASEPWISPADRRPRDVAGGASFSIRQNADATLTRVENVFFKFGYKQI